MNLENTIFIDECKIEIETHLPHRWRKVGNRMYKTGKPKHPLKLLLLGGISTIGATPLTIFRGILNSSDLIKLFDEGLTPFIKYFF